MDWNSRKNNNNKEMWNENREPMSIFKMPSNNCLCRSFLSHSSILKDRRISFEHLVRILLPRTRTQYAYTAIFIDRIKLCIRLHRMPIIQKSWKRNAFERSREKRSKIPKLSVFILKSPPNKTITTTTATTNKQQAQTHTHLQKVSN